MTQQGKIVGHIVSKNGITTNTDKIFVIVNLPRPNTIKEVQSYMGHCRYYRRFIHMYAVIAKPLYRLLASFDWTQECELSFERLKQAMINAPILKSLDHTKIFHVHVDALAYALGFVLAQPWEDSMDFAINYASQKLNATYRNYTTIKREGLETIFVVKSFNIASSQTNLCFS